MTIWKLLNFTNFYFKIIELNLLRKVVSFVWFYREEKSYKSLYVWDYEIIIITQINTRLKMSINLVTNSYKLKR